MRRIEDSFSWGESQSGRCAISPGGVFGSLTIVACGGDQTKQIHTASIFSRVDCYEGSRKHMMEKEGKEARYVKQKTLPTCWEWMGPKIWFYHWDPPAIVNIEALAILSNTHLSHPREREHA